MMKTKKIIATVMAACMLTGCQLAKEDTSKTQDKLIGVFITDEYLNLFDFEGYLNDNLNNFSGGDITLNENRTPYEGRLYATFESEDKQDIKFGDIWGIPFFKAEFAGDDGVSSVASYGGDGIIDSKFGTYYKDDEDKITLDGTIYIMPNVAGLTHYFNNVYQSEDGQIYAIAGQGMSVSGVQSQGGLMSTKIEETVEITENGVSKKKTIIINIAIETKLPPSKINVLVLDNDSNIISKSEYAPNKLPEIIKADKKVGYIIVENYMTDFDGKELIERQLYDKNTTMIKTFYESENNLLAQQYTELVW